MKLMSQTKSVYIEIISSMGIICGFSFAISKIFSITPSASLLIVYAIIELLIILAIIRIEMIAAKRREPILLGSFAETVIFGGAISLYYFLAKMYLGVSLTYGLLATALFFVIISTLLYFTKAWVTIAISLTLYIGVIIFAYPRVDKEIFYTSNLFLIFMLSALLVSSININKVINSPSLKDYDKRSKLRLCNMYYLFEVLTFFLGTIPGTFFINKVVILQSEIQSPD
jgi:cbb3-type cytochrome oxidase subunit 3